MANKRPGSKALIKDINKILVLSTIREHGPVSRTDVARITKLNLSTISKICDELYRQNMLFDIGEGISSGGRRPIQMLFNNNLGYILSVKIEESHLQIALTNLKPSIIDYHEYLYDHGQDYPSVLKLIEEKIIEISDELREKDKSLLGIGIALSGIINQDRGELLSSTFLGWEKETLVEDLKKNVDAPVFIDNDVNCYALAQHWLGSGKGHSNFICLTIGEGIGGALIIRNRLYRGHRGGAGELGHMIIQTDGKPCYCGQKGCLEAYASYPAIVSRMKELTDRSYNIAEIAKLAEEGDSDARVVMRQAGKYLGSALINLTMTCNPELIIIGGEGIKELKSFLPSIQNQFDENWFTRSGLDNTPILFDEPGNRFFLLGAALLVIDHLFGAPLYETENPLL